MVAPNDHILLGKLVRLGSVLSLLSDILQLLLVTV
jgi:hypothetical protein